MHRQDRFILVDEGNIADEAASQLNGAFHGVIGDFRAGNPPWRESDQVHYTVFVKILYILRRIG